MKITTNTSRIKLLMVLFVTGIFCTTPAQAASIYFNSTYGTIWDNATTADWSLNLGGPYNQLWGAGGNYDAHFQGSAGIVTVAGTVNNINSINFDVSGYTLNGGTLTLASTGGQIISGLDSNTISSTVTIPNGSNNSINVQSLTGSLNLTGTVSAPQWVADSAILTKDGLGILVLGNNGTADADNSYSYLVAHAGTVQLNKNSGFNTHAIWMINSIDSGATVQLTGSGTYQIWSAGTVKLTGGIFDLNGHNQTNTNLYVNTAGSTLANSSTTTASVYNPFNVYLNTSLNVSATGDIEVSSVLSGAGGIVKTGSGVFNISGVNTFTGTTIINEGTLRLGNSNSLKQSTLDYNYGGTLSFGSLVSATLGGLSGSQTLSLTNYSSASVAVSIGNNNQSTTYSGAISGAGSLNKIGTGTLTFTGSKTYTGDTTISAGILQLGDAGTLNGSVAGNIINNAELVFANPGSQTYSGVISGAGTLTKSSTGALTLSGANTFTGKIKIQGGVLVIGSANTLQNSTLDYNNYGGTLSFGDLSAAALGGLTGSQTLSLTNDSSAPVTLIIGNNNQSSTFSGVMSGAGTLNKVGTSTSTLAGANSYSGGTTISTGTLIASNTGALPGYATSGQVVVNSGGTIVVDAVDWDLADIETLRSSATFNTGSFLGIDTTNTPGGFTYSNAIGGNQGLNKLGANTLTLTVANTYTGGTKISGGTLSFVNDSLGTGGFTFGGGALQWAGGNTQDISSRIASIADGQVAILDTNGNDVPFASVISGGGGLTKIGSGRLTFTGSKTYTGDTTISAGVLQLGDAGTLNGSVAGNIINNAELVFANPGSQTYSGVISGTGSLTKSSTGTLILSGANTFTGKIKILGGALVFGNANTLQNSILDYNNYGGTLSFGDLSAAALGGLTGSQTLSLTNDSSAPVTLSIGNNNNQSSTFSGVMSGAGTLNKVGTSAFTISGANSYSGGTTISTGTLIASNTGALPGYATSGQVVVNSGGTIAVDAGGWDLADIETLRSSATFNTGSFLGIDTTNTPGGFTYSNAIGGNQGLNKLGANTLTLTVANTYTGGTKISGGTLCFTNGNVLGTGSITFSGGALQWAGGNTQDISSRIASIADGQVAILDTNGNDVPFASVISGGGGLTKIGSGRLTFTGSKTYTGDTTISAGVLQLGDAISLNGSVAGNIINNAELVFANPNSQTYSKVISGIGNLTKSGLYALTLSSANTFSGDTKVTSGTLLVANSNALQNSTLDYDGYGGTLRFTGLSSAALGGLKGNQNLSLLDNLDPFSGISLSVGSNNESTTYGGVLCGVPAAFGTTGLLIKIGTGTLTLTNMNTAYVSVPAMVSAGTLQLGDGTTNGSIAGNITNNAALIFNNTGTQTFSNVISGTGSLTKSGPGMLTLTGANTYAGGTIISGGMLNVNSDSHLGAVPVSAKTNISFNSDGTLQWGATFGINTKRQVSIGSGANATFDVQNYSGTIAGAISGAGNLTKTGSGKLTLTASNSYTGSTTISAGSLQLGDGTTNGSIAGNITNNAALIFNNTGTQTFSNVISGTGSLTKSGPGTLTLTGANTYAGGTIISGGTLNVNSDSRLGAVPVSAQMNISFNGNSTLQWNATFDTNANRQISIGSGITATFDVQSNSGTIASLISGAGNLTKIGSGKLTLTAANTYTGSTTISAGMLQLGEGTTNGSIAGNITDNASLIFNNTGTQTFSRVISGTGSLTKSGPGMLILTGANTYAGGTIISGGMLNVNSDSRLGAVPVSAKTNISFNSDGTLQWGATFGINTKRQVSIGSGANATFDVQNYSGTIAGAISGAGNLTKTGSGKLTLTASNSYTGSTTIDAGTLALGANNALPTATDVILGGGTIATGAFSQTNSLGRLTLNSDSMIDMAIVGSSILNFTDSHLMSWSGRLTISNWNGSLSGGGADELFLGSSASAVTPDQLDDIIFTNPINITGEYQARILATGEIVPVPEPATVALLAGGDLLLGGLALRRWRRRTISA